MIKTIQSKAGHTVVEMLVALAILSIALVPTVQFTAKIMSNAVSRDLIVAAQLARGEIERVISKRDYLPDETRVSVNQKSWRIERAIEVHDNLVHIHVKVYKNKSNKPIAELRTTRLFN